MNRRGILALLGGAVAMPSVGVKAATEALGVSNVVGLGVGSGSVEVAGCSPSSGGWWGSPLQIALEAKQSASHVLHSGQAYPHMKSWGHAFRTAAVERDYMILAAYRQKMQDDSDFREKVLTALGMVG